MHIIVIVVIVKDNVYGAVIVAVHCLCESSPGSSDECSTQRQVAADLLAKPQIRLNWQLQYYTHRRHLLLLSAQPES